MTPNHADPWPGEQALVRPFLSARQLGRPRPNPDPVPAAAPPFPGDPVSAAGTNPPGPGGSPAPGAAPGPAWNPVRPYLLTGGRTFAAGTGVAMETVVAVTGAAVRLGGGPAAGERLRILAVCAQPRSVAEVAALIDVPLAVALVLVTDLVTEGSLDATTIAARQADDVYFLERLIAGVAAL